MESLSAPGELVFGVGSYVEADSRRGSRCFRYVCERRILPNAAVGEGHFSDDELFVARVQRIGREATANANTRCK